MRFYFYHPACIVACVLAVAISILDFRSRLYVSRASEIREFSAPVIPSIAAPTPRSVVVREVAAWVGEDESFNVKPRELVLQGIFFTTAGPRAALSLVDANGRSPQRVRAVVGDEVEGWKIEAIEARRVIIRRGSESRELVLFKRH